MNQTISNIDASHIYSGSQDSRLRKDLQTIEKIGETVEKIEDILGRKSIKASELHGMLDGLEETMEVINRIFFYCHLNFLNNTERTSYEDLEKQVLSCQEEFYMLQGYISRVLFHLPDEFLEQYFAKYGRDYEPYIRRAIDELENQTENECSVEIDMGELYERYQLATSSFMIHGKIGDEEKQWQLTEFEKFRSNTNREVRKQAYILFGKAIEAVNKEIDGAHILNQMIISRHNYALSLGKHSLEGLACQNEQIPSRIFDQLIESKERMIHITSKYRKAKQVLLQVPTLEPYDVDAPIPGKSVSKVPYDAAVNHIIQVATRFDQKMGKMVHDLFEESRIDAHPRPGKSIGAACISTKNVPPYIFMNYDGLPKDAYCLEHETGHAIADALSQKANILNGPRTTILDEVFAFFFERLCMEVRLQEANETEQVALMHQFTSTQWKNIIGQARCLTFEHSIAEKSTCSDGQLSNEEITKVWLETVYDGTDREDRESWSIVPHFYMIGPRGIFYTMSYPIAQFIANRLFTIYQTMPREEFVEKFSQMAKAGGNQKLDKLLQIFDIDIHDSSFIDQGLDDLEKTVDEYTTLVQKERSI